MDKMIDKIFETVKKSLNGDKPFLRKLRILRYIVCIIILFIVFCSSYWNVLEYIDLPCAPLLAEKYRMLLHIIGIVGFVIWIVYNLLFQNLYKIYDEKYHMKLLYIDILLDFLFTVIFLLYAINLGIEYANGLETRIKVQAFIATAYLIVHHIRCIELDMSVISLLNIPDIVTTKERLYRLKQEFFIKVKDTKLLSFKKYIDCYHLMRR